MTGSIEDRGRGAEGRRRGERDSPAAGQEHLRVLLADGDQKMLDRTAQIVAELGHAVIGVETELAHIGRLVLEHRPDIVLLGVGPSEPGSPDRSRHALGVVSEIVLVAYCPVVALMDTEDPDWVAQASARGIAAYVSPVGRDQVMSALHIARRRFGAYRSLEDAFERRAITERAKGVLMERHQIDERMAFEMLRRQARGSGRRLTDVADAVLQGHRLLPDLHRAEQTE